MGIPSCLYRLDSEQLVFPLGMGSAYSWKKKKKHLTLSSKEKYLILESAENAVYSIDSTECIGAASVHSLLLE